MSAFDRLSSIQVSPRMAAYSMIALVVVLSGVVVTVRKVADTSPAYAVADKPAAKSTGVNAKVDEKTDKAKGKESKADDPYAIIIERNLFRPVAVGSLAVTETQGAKPTPPPPVKSPLPPMPVAPAGNIDEVKKNIAFTGAVGMPSGQQALIENLQTKETRFVSQGESAFGYRVMTISSQLVVLEKNGLQFTLTMGENKTDAPPAPGPKPGEQKPGQPGQPGGPEGGHKPGG
jgi:hypothetical protein